MTLHDLYLEAAARRRRKERFACVAFVLLGALATCLFVYSLLTPQP